MWGHSVERALVVCITAPLIPVPTMPPRIQLTSTCIRQDVGALADAAAMGHTRRRAHPPWELICSQSALAAWYFWARKAVALSKQDANGATFAIERATEYCAEDEYTRLSRDIVVFTAGNKFLVKKWGSGGHRSQASHGNAFGTFIYRPPKNIPASEGDIKFAVPMWEVDAMGWLLTFVIDGVGPKDREMATLFGEKEKEAMLSSALTSEAKCYVMPSSSQSGKSSIAAPMTTLVTFTQHAEIDLDDFPDYAWASTEQALDPSFNVHAGIVASYCLEKGMASSELLEKYGWTEREMPVMIQLPEDLSTLDGWGIDVASIYTSMKRLLLKESRIQAPRQRRRCEVLNTHV